MARIRQYFPGICDICLRHKRRVHRQHRTGRLICRGCSSLVRYHNQRKWEICIKCGEKKSVGKRLPGKQALCHYCYRKTLVATCAICGKSKPIAARKAIGPVCNTCYERQFNQEHCSQCGHLRPVKKRTGDGKPICPACYKWKGGTRRRRQI